MKIQKDNNYNARPCGREPLNPNTFRPGALNFKTLLAAFFIKAITLQVKQICGRPRETPVRERCLNGDIMRDSSA